MHFQKLVVVFCVPVSQNQGQYGQVIRLATTIGSQKQAERNQYLMGEEVWVVGTSGGDNLHSWNKGGLLVPLPPTLTHKMKPLIHSTPKMEPMVERYGCSLGSQ